MKHSTAVAMIVEAHRQGQSAAQHLYDIATKQMLDAFPTQMVEALRAENERLQAEVARLTVETEADRELARLVRAMPVGATLEHSAGDDFDWIYHVPGNGTYFRETPAVALIAAGTGQEEEPCQSI